MQNLIRNLLGDKPVGKLIRKAAKNDWKIIIINALTSLLTAITEGATLGIIFLAISVLSGSNLPESWEFPYLSSLKESFSPASDPDLSKTFLFSALLGAALLMQGLQAIAKYINLVSTGFFAAKSTSIITNYFNNQVFKLSFRCSSNYKVGELSQMGSDAPRAIQIAIEQSSILTVNCLLAITYVVVLITISPWLLISVLFISILIAIVQKIIVPKIKAGSKNVERMRVNINAVITENIQSLRLLHSTGQIDTVSNNLKQKLVKLEKELKKQSIRLSIISPFSTFLPILAVTLIALSSILIFENENNYILPSLATFVLALQRLNSKISEIAQSFNRLAENSGKLEILDSFLSSEGKEYRQSKSELFRGIKNSVTFSNVYLSYSSSSAPVLKGISFNIEKGISIGLVGSSGAGKSSIADLLTGLYLPTKGSIFIDDTDLTELDLTSWQKSLGIVSQDTFLFNASIADNVAFCKPSATRKEIIDACKLALADGFIDNLPQGYDTQIGERGYRLSGGQRQRLSLARAFLRRPELLILDEATSALDTNSERLVQKAIESFGKTHTLLVIAHRLSTIINVDKIIVLESGKISQVGNHKDLIAQDGIYKNLWKMQSEFKK